MVGGLTHLVDTNVWLEVLLDQENAPSAMEFLAKAPPASLAMTDFTLFSIAIILVRLKKGQLLATFLADTLEDGSVRRLSLEIDDLTDVLAACDSLKLDFDDAYQYVAAEKHGLAIVSFDKDFDKTPRGRKSPAHM
jgi:predicted nucleic acid-binding protein